MASSWGAIRRTNYGNNLKLVEDGGMGKGLAQRLCIYYNRYFSCGGDYK
jgi:hypothetical protein